MNTVLQWALWLVLMSLVMGWLARSRIRKRVESDANALRHPNSVLIIGAVTSAFFVALAVLSHLFPGKSGSPAISLVFVGFALLGVLVIAEYFRAWHRLEPGGLRYRTLFQKGVLQWNDVTRVRYSPAAMWFRIDTAQGHAVRLSVMLRGLPDFARTIMQEVSPAKIDSDTAAILEQTASGAPPSVWG